jgi:UPF0716 protein FxsA
MRILLLLILLYPVAELVAIISMASHFGSLATFIYLAVSMLFGLFLLRNQKLAQILSLASLMRSGNGPVAIYPLLWPLRTLLAGVLFIIPGPLSDVAGLLLLLPIQGPTLRTPQPVPPHDIIEGEFHTVDEPGQRHLR